MSESTKPALLHIPFSTHEIFAVMIPATTLLLCVYSLEAYISKHSSGVFPDLHLHSFVEHAYASDHRPFSVEVSIAVATLAAIYVLGSVIASISSLCLDRVLVYKAYGYPYQRLILDEVVSRRKKVSRMIYRGTVFWINVVLLVMLIVRTHGWTFHWPYILFGVIIPLLASKSIAQAVYSKRRTASSPGTKVSRARARIARAKRWVTAVLHKHRDRILLGAKWYAFGYNIIGDFVENYIRTKDSLEDQIRNRFVKLFEANFQVSILKAKSNIYWFTRFYVFQIAPRLGDQINGWYLVSNFARNMATAFYVAFLYSCYLVFVDRVIAREYGTNAVLAFALAFVLLSVIMSIRFYYFYVAYYSKGLFRAFVFLHCIPTEKGIGAELMSHQVGTPDQSE